MVSIDIAVSGIGFQLVSIPLPEIVSLPKTNALSLASLKLHWTVNDWKVT